METTLNITNNMEELKNKIFGKYGMDNVLNGNIDFPLLEFEDLRDLADYLYLTEFDDKLLLTEGRYNIMTGLNKEFNKRLNDEILLLYGYSRTRRLAITNSNFKLLYKYKFSIAPVMELKCLKNAFWYFYVSNGMRKTKSKFPKHIESYIAASDILLSSSFTDDENDYEYKNNFIKYLFNEKFDDAFKLIEKQVDDVLNKYMTLF